MHCRVDVATLTTPYAALKQSVHIFWPDEDAWFPGTVVSYDQDTGKHKASPYAHSQFLAVPFSCALLS